ncbi:Bax inhibitor-1/YccA family protein [Leptolyngbya ohadii]|uniref:Bax inhibitor-1/YccA family protein n=1 Tax=Leptolyngbya ohadii TaxID=1962290 RepID=UPI000B59CF14|nr:Bax inhibitor-1 family protein [Leptolyngbya ohadii]
MSNTSNFRGAIREAKGLPILGPNVISKALPFLGAGLVLTAVGAYGGLGMIASPLFMPLFIGAMIAQIVLFFVASNVAQQGKNSVALPLLAAYSLLSGYTLSALIFVALGTQGVGIMGIVAAALGCGIAFIVGRPIGSNLSDKDGLALSKTVSIGIIALFGVLLVQLAFAFFGVGTPSFLEIAISGMGVLLFVGASVVDFYVLPRTYTDEQYLPVALSMYLTYINLFIFILRLLIAINSRD